MGRLRASIPGLIRCSHFFWSKISLHGLHWFTQVYIRLPPDETHLTRGLNLSFIDSPDEVDPILQSEYRAIKGPLMYLYQ